MKILGIFASDPLGVIGNQGKLPWHEPEDLRHFEKVTEGNILVMGHKTFLTLPKRFLSQEILVFSRHPFSDNRTNIHRIASLEAFFSLSLNKSVFVCGGAEIFRLFLEKNLIETLIQTEMKKPVKGDTFFPLDLIKNWPRELEQETEIFRVYRYFRPKKSD